MYSNKLSIPLEISTPKNISDTLDELYLFFKDNILDRDKRIKLFGKDIFIDCGKGKWIRGKNEVFWHLTSLKKREKFNVLPCSNCKSSSICPQNCLEPTIEVMLSNGEKRNICIYRGRRINWFIDVVRMANEKDENVQTWRENLGQGKFKLFLRFRHQSGDYVVIFEEKWRRKELIQYRLLSAFPVFYINKKREFDKKFREYQNKTTEISIIGN
ncbi:hypothetical protein M3936_23530 [Sutcliffiella horikoshii]|uniref:hypothetical protein n=1 Tax=Sutcliffiella horikoshii TaxID=79883 RepID=UPI0007D047B8|nr:hypothetical protein [Sutcliffiella horikoshii]MCM3620530.1 hypothetical protein [Sutcliffiella horikoshii]